MSQIVVLINDEEIEMTHNTPWNIKVKFVLADAGFIIFDSNALTLNGTTDSRVDTVVKSAVLVSDCVITFSNKPSERGEKLLKFASQHNKTIYSFPPQDEEKIPKLIRSIQKLSEN